MPTSERRTRWHHLTPGRFVLTLLAVDVLLWLSDRFGWLGWHKGYAVLTGVAAVGVAMLVMLAWFAVSLLFRRRFQFSIRSLLVLVVVVAVPCSWMTVEMKKAERQQVAKTAFQRFPGYVMYGYERSGQQSASLAPSWLCRSLGCDFFASIEFVCLACDKRFTDADMEHVESLPRLKMLRLGGANITNDGLQHLAVLTDLEELSLHRTQVGDAGLEHVQGLTQLRRLNLYATNISDSGLKYLKRFGRLEDLCLAKTKVTDAGLAQLEVLNQLQTLQINSTQVTDSGLEHLKALTQLQYLDLENTQVTDAGLEPIEGFAKLERLDLCGTKVTDVGVAKLQQALPNCKINR